MSADLAPPRISSLSRTQSQAASPKAAFFHIDPAATLAAPKTSRRKSIHRFALSKVTGRGEIPAFATPDDRATEDSLPVADGPRNLAELEALRAVIDSLHDQARAQVAERRRRSIESAELLRSLLVGTMDAVPPPPSVRSGHRRCRTVGDEAECSYSVRRKAVPPLDSKLLEAAAQRSAAAAAAATKPETLATLDYATFEAMFHKPTRALDVDAAYHVAPPRASLNIPAFSTDEQEARKARAVPSFFRSPARKSSKKDLKAAISGPIPDPSPMLPRQVHRARSQVQLRPRAAVAEKPQGRGISLAEALMMDDDDDDEADDADDAEVSPVSPSGRAARRATLHISPSAIRETFAQARAAEEREEEGVVQAVQTPLTARPSRGIAVLASTLLTPRVPDFVSQMDVWSSSPNDKQEFEDGQGGASPPFSTPMRMSETSSPELSFTSSSGGSTISDFEDSEEEEE